MSSIERVELNDGDSSTELSNGVEELFSANDDYKEIVVGINEVENSVACMENLKAAFVNTPTHSEEALDVFIAAMEHHRDVINTCFAKQIIPSFESLSTESFSYGLEYQDPMVSAVNFIANSIINTWKYASKAFLDMITFTYDVCERFLRNTKELKQRLRNSGSKPRRPYIRATGLAKLHVGGKVDLKSVMTGIDNAEKVIDAVTGTYRKAVLNHYKETTKSYINAVSEVTAHYQDHSDTARELVSTDMKKFIEYSEKSLTRALGSLPKDTEISGGKVFAMRHTSFSSVPTVFNVNRSISVPNKVDMDTPSKQQIEKMLANVEGIANIVHNRKTNLVSAFMEIETAIAEGLDEGRAIDTNVIFRYVAGLNNNIRVLFSHTWFTYPIAETTATVFFSSRKILKLCEMAISEYE